MKQYKMFENEVGRREALKQGWSWPAFFFRFIWGFVKRLYVAGAIVLGGVIVVVFLSWTKSVPAESLESGSSTVVAVRLIQYFMMRSLSFRVVG